MFVFVAISYLICSKVASLDISVDLNYWPLRPYIFENNNQTDGMLPKFIESLNSYCKSALNFTVDVVFKKVASSRANFRISDPQSSFEQLVIWGPFISSQTTGELNKEYSNKYSALEFFRGTTMVIIVDKRRIFLLNKLITALKSNYVVIIIIILIAIYIGILMWLVEHPSNKEFNKSFYKGAGTGIWWSFVTVMTVGYGDVIPKRLVGRMLAVCYILFGIFNCNLTTALITESVFGESGVSIYEKKIAVLNNSAEQRVAIFDFNASLLLAESYEEVIELVRNGEAFAALMKEDVAAWMYPPILNDKENVPLAVVEKIQRDFSINFLATHNEAIASYSACLKSFEKELYTIPENMFKRNIRTETVYFPKPKEYLRNIYLYVLFATASCVITASIIFELKKKIQRKRFFFNNFINLKKSFYEFRNESVNK